MGLVCDARGCHSGICRALASRGLGKNSRGENCDVLGRGAVGGGCICLGVFAVGVRFADCEWKQDDSWVKPEISNSLCTRILELK